MSPGSSSLTGRRGHRAVPATGAGHDVARLVSLESADDRSLVHRLEAGCHDAFAEIFERHSGPSLALAHRLMGDAQRAEEVVQEVFVRLWTQPERYDPCRGALRTFLMADVHGRAIDVLRSDGRRVNRELRDHDRLSDVTYVDDSALGRIAASEFRKTLSRLPAVEGEAISLAYFEGYTYREVARLLGQPEGTIKSRIRSGLSRLRVELDVALAEHNR